MSLKDKVIIVTGGSKGIGFATAEALVEQGAKVSLIARSQESLDAAVDKLGDSAIGFSADVSDRESVFNAFAETKAHYGKVDGVINNAGLALPNKIETLPAKDLALQVQVNFVGLVYCCQAAIPLLRETSGRMINISSASVRHDNEMAHMSIYSATKAAVVRFTEELREEVKADGISVTLFSPGFALTEFGAGWEEGTTMEAIKEWGARSPNFNGSMQASDVAQALAHCIDYPSGVAVDFMEVRPNVPTAKPVFE